MNHSMGTLFSSLSSSLLAGSTLHSILSVYRRAATHRTAPPLSAEALPHNSDSWMPAPVGIFCKSFSAVRALVRTFNFLLIDSLLTVGTLSVVFSLVVISWLGTSPESLAQPALSIVNLDTTAFPREMRARFVLTDARGVRINPDTSNIRIFENGSRRRVLRVEGCGPSGAPITQRGISLTMSFDISGSMFRSARSGLPRSLDLSKEAARLLVSAVDFTRSEIAVQWCDDKAVLAQDFTQDRARVLNALPNPIPDQGNDFVEHLLNPFAGLLNVAKRSRLVGTQRIAFLMTDAFWFPLTPQELRACIDTCAKYDIKFYALLFGPIASSPGRFTGISASFRALADATGGKIYEAILSSDNVNEVLRDLTQTINISNAGDPCTVVWQTAVCEPETRLVQMEVDLNGSVVRLSPFDRVVYFANNRNQSPPLRLSVQRIFMRVLQTRTTPIDTTITITAPTPTPPNYSVTIVGGESLSDVLTITPRTVRFSPTQQTQTVRISYIPRSDEYNLATLDFIANDGSCPQTLTFAAGLPGKSPGYVGELKLLRPNGGEKFAVGDAESVLWTGIPPNENVRLQYSLNGGRTWIDESNPALRNAASNVFRLIHKQPDNVDVSGTLALVDTTRGAAMQATTTAAGSSMQVRSVRWMWDSVYNTPNRRCLMRVAQFEGSFVLDTTIKHTEYRNVTPISTGFSTIYPLAASDNRPGGVIMVPRQINAAMSFAPLATGGGGVTSFGPTQRASTVGAMKITRGGDPLRDSYLVSASGGALLLGMSQVERPMPGAGGVNITAVAVTPGDGTYVAVGFEDGAVRVYDYGTDTNTDLRLVREYTTAHRSAAGRSAVTSLQFSGENAARLLSAGEDGTIKVWNPNVAGQQPLFELRDPQSAAPVRSAAFDPQADLVVSGGDDGIVKLWVLGASGFSALRGHGIDRSDHNSERRVNAVAFDPTGEFIVSGGQDGTVRLWDVQSGALRVAENRMTNARFFEHVAFFPNSSRNDFRLAVAGGNFAYIWRPVLPPRVLQTDESDREWEIIKPDGRTRNVDMGTTEVGKRIERMDSLFITNTTEVPLTISQIRLEGQDAAMFKILSSPEVRIEPNGTRGVEFAFTPTSVGPKQASVRVVSRLGETITTVAESRTAPLAVIRGNAVAQAIENRFPTTCIDFGLVTGTANRQGVEVLNILLPGVQIVNVEQLVVGNAQRFFADFTNNGVLPVGPYRINVRFVPTPEDLRTEGVQSFSGGMRITYRDPSGRQDDVVITFCAQLMSTRAPRIEAQTANVTNLLVPACAATSSTGTLTIRNTGDGTLTFNAAIRDNSGAFSFDTTTASTANPTMLAGTLPPDSAHTFRVLFNPSRPLNASTASIVITSNDATRATLTLPLSGRRDDVGFRIGTTATGAGGMTIGMPSGALTGTTTGVTTIVFAPALPSIASVTTITITNTGDTPLRWTAPIAFDNGLFQIETISPLVIPPGGTAAASVRFAGDPRELQVIDRTYRLPAPDFPCFALDIRLIARTLELPKPRLAALTTSVSFPPTTCLSAELPLAAARVQNQGEADLQIRDIRFANGRFFRLHPSQVRIFSIDRGLISEIRIVFDAAAATTSGEYRDELIIASNDPARPEIRIPVVATRNVAQIMITPSVVDFGTVDFGSMAPLVRLFTITVTGTVPFVVPNPLPRTDNFAIIALTPVSTSSTVISYQATVRFVGPTMTSGSYEEQFSFSDGCGITTVPVRITIGRPPSAVLRVDSATARVGDTVQIGLYLTNRMNIKPSDQVVTARLGFNASMLSVLDAGLRSRSWVDTDGLRWIPLDMRRTQDNETIPLTTIALRAVLGTSDATRLIISDARLEMLPIESTSSIFRIRGLSNADGLPTLNPSTPSAQVLNIISAQPAPVPRGEDFVVEYEAKRDIAVDVTLTTVMGVVADAPITLLPANQAKQGRNTITIKTSSLPPGLYFVNIRSALLSLTRRLIVIQ